MRRFAGSLLLAVACRSGSSPDAAPGAAAESSAARTAPPASAAAVTASASAGSAPAPQASAEPAASAGPATEPKAAKKGGRKKRGGSARTVSDARITLLDAGKEPRRELRYAFRARQKETMRLTTATEITISVGGQSMPAPPAPSIELPATITIKRLDDDGTAHRSIRIGRPLLIGTGVPAALRAEAERALGGLEGLVARDAITTRGFVTSLELGKITRPGPGVEQLVEAIETSVSQVSAPLPEEPVGQGARWEARGHVEQYGLSIDQLATYELVELHGNRGKTRFTIEQSAAAGSFSPPGLPPGVTTTLEELKSTGSGSSSFDLDRIVPEGELGTRTRMRLAVGAGAGGSGKQMQMETSVRVEFSPKTKQ